jgi:hypothetical protein
VLCSTGALDPRRTAARTPAGSCATRASPRSPARRSTPSPKDGAGQIRFAFPKTLETLHAAAERIAALRG